MHRVHNCHPEPCSRLRLVRCCGGVTIVFSGDGTSILHVQGNGLIDVGQSAADYNAAGLPALTMQNSGGTTVSLKH